jgi:competence protein ComGC
MKMRQIQRQRACPPQRQRQRAFTLFEGLVVVTVLALVAAILLSALATSHRKINKVGCDNNLRQIGIAVRIWEGDNDDKYPMAVPAALGGAQEMMATGNVAPCFQVMSNELSAPKILLCPTDAGHWADTNPPDVAWTCLSRTNISYFMGLDAVETAPLAVLSGDGNLAQHGRAVPTGIVNLATNVTTWTTNCHNRCGYILFADGSVQAATQISSSTAPGTFPSTNRVVVP